MDGSSSLPENLEGESPTRMSCPKAQAYLCYVNVPNTPAISHLSDHEEKEKRFWIGLLKVNGLMDHKQPCKEECGLCIVLHCPPHHSKSFYLFACLCVGHVPFLSFQISISHLNISLRLSAIFQQRHPKILIISIKHRTNLIPSAFSLTQIPFGLWN